MSLSVKEISSGNFYIVLLRWGSIVCVNFIIRFKAGKGTTRNQTT